MFRAILSAQYLALVAGLGVVFGAAVPVAAVDEHSDSALAQNQVGRAGELRLGSSRDLKRMPRRCTAERTANSGLVSRLRLPCIDLRLPGDEAQDPLPEPSATYRTLGG